MKPSMFVIVQEVLGSDVGEVLSSPLLLKLLSAYSALYLNGGNPSYCGDCHRKYYYQLKKDGLMKAQEYDAAQNRTCEPAWRGLMFIHKLARHYNSELLTDEQAIKLLQAGHLKESDFKKLPEGYKTVTKEDTAPEAKEDVKKTVKAKPKKTKNEACKH